MLRHVDLCSGIGGFSLGFSWAELSKPVLFCDTEKWCRKILAKNFPNVPIATDVKELANEPERLVPECDILSAGYPCQPFSVAGLQKAEKDDRHIWPYIFRIITQKRPSWLVLENVYGHVALGLDKVLLDLESQGYATRTFIVPACAKNAPHRRDRLWIIGKNVEDTTSGRCEERNTEPEEVSGIVRPSSGASSTKNVADTQRLGWEQRSKVQEEFDREGSSNKFDFSSEGRTRSRPSSHVADSKSERTRKNDKRIWSGSEGIGRGEGTTLANTNDKGSQRGVQGWPNSEWETLKGYSGCISSSYGQPEQDIWNVEPNVGRVAHGVPQRVDRLKGLGNAIVPQIAMQIGLAIKADINEPS